MVMVVGVIAVVDRRFGRNDSCDYIRMAVEMRHLRKEVNRMSDLCDDNRFELIEKYKQELIESTNIETAPDEMKVLDDILFRFWQMGWLDQKVSSSCGQENDLISRQALLKQIDIDSAGAPGYYGDTWKFIDTIKNMPPAQPEKHTEERTETHACDSISRQDAIDAVKRLSLGETDATRLAMRIGDYLERLSPAQPEPIRINLNEPIKVKLTDWGKEIYYHQYDRINQIVGREACKPSFPKEDENGYAEFQLWCFMELYGECMGMTLPNVIEPLEIVYER